MLPKSHNILCSEGSVDHYYEPLAYRSGRGNSGGAAHRPGYVCPRHRRHQVRMPAVRLSRHPHPCPYPGGRRAIGKPEGRYITIDLRPALSRQEALTGRAALCLCRELRALLPPPSDGPALVVGLGNDAMTPDAVGAAALEHLLVTRHMVRSMPRQFGALTPVAALATGVLARTGVETLELIRGAADRLHPSVVIAIDALAARSRHRLCATVQLGDTGLIPGSGVGNHRKAVNARTLGRAGHRPGRPHGHRRRGPLRRRGRPALRVVCHAPGHRPPRP